MAIYGTTPDATSSQKGKVQLTGDLGGTASSPILTLNSICQGRLTLTSGTPITTSDVTAAGTIYFTPYKGNKVALYDGSAWALYTLTERSLALTLTSDMNYDIFLYNNSGTLTLESLVWTNDTTRATNITLQDGIYVKSGATTRRYLGTIRASATNQTEDSYAKRFVYNYYNRVTKPLLKIDETGHTYTTASFREWNGSSTATRIGFVQGVLESQTTVFLTTRMTGTGNFVGYLNVAMNSTTTRLFSAANDQYFLATGATSTELRGMSSGGTTYSALGYNYATCIEFGQTGITYQSATVTASAEF